MKRNCVSTRGIAYEDVGDGPAVLLIHAFGFDADMWEPQVAHMRSSGYRVITPDLRGFGASPGPTDLHTFDETVADVVGVMDDAGVERTVVGGVSMGAATSAALTIQHPERVVGLLIADNSRPDGLDRAIAARNRILMLGMEGLADVYEPILFGDSYRERAPEAIDHWRRKLVARDPQELATVVRFYHDRPDPYTGLAGISVPTMLVFGEDDAAIPPARRNDYASIPGARISTIPDSGHMSNMEQPDIFNSLLADLAARAYDDGDEADGSAP